MKLFLAVFLCSSFTDVKALGCESELWPCSLVGDIAIITCAGAAPGDDPPDCESNSEDYTMEAGVKSIDADSCRDLCVKQKEAGGNCAFYRWENKDDGQCSLQTTCGAVDVTCDDPHKCVSGEIGCSDSGEEECNLDAPTTWNHENFHWICFNGEINVNIYDGAQIKGIPDGTFCKTTHKCSTWSDIDDNPTLQFWRKLGIFCDGGLWRALDDKGSENDKTGSAEESRNSIKPTDPTDPNKGVSIIEPSCASKCESLRLNHVEDIDGTEIFCDEPLENGDNLVNGNSCILICDNHWTMSISCEFTEKGDEHDGEKEWQDQNGELVTDDKVMC